MVRKRPLKQDVSFQELPQAVQTKITKGQQKWKQKGSDVLAERALKKAQKNLELKEKRHRRVIWQIRKEGRRFQPLMSLLTL